MTTKTKSETTETPVAEQTSKNKTIFGPLGKYAAVAVIMVSVIVTTAIMLGKQLSTVDQELASIENTVAQKFSSKTEVKDETVAVAVDTPAATIEETTIIAESANETEVVAIEESTAEVLITAETTIASDNAATKTAAIEQDVTAAEPAQFELASDSRAEQQARIEAFKVQQKKRMAEMFARIKTLESQQLNQYKTNQEGQIARLREQIAQQSKMIEALVLRNKDHYDLRAANIQRVQSSRQQMLNRI